MSDQKGPGATGKRVIHLDNSSTRGHAVGNTEYRALAASAEGYSVQPTPLDGNEHLISPGRGRRPFQPCPACTPKPEKEPSA